MFCYVIVISIVIVSLLCLKQHTATETAGGNVKVNVDLYSALS